MTGDRVMAWGAALTLLLTLPIVGALVFGIPGLLIGLVLGIVFSAKPLQKIAKT